MTDSRQSNRHRSGCTCERCFAPVIDFMVAQSGGTQTKEEDPLPTTRAELQAALDRAYHAGVKHGRMVEQRERAA